MTDRETESGEVNLARGKSASKLFHGILAATVETFPETFATVDMPVSAQEFRRHFAEVLPRFEAARADSDRRFEIATRLVNMAAAAINWTTDRSEESVTQHLAKPASPLPLETKAFRGEGRLRPLVKSGGADLVGDELEAFARGLVKRGAASVEAAQSLGWIMEHAGTKGIDLRDRRVAVLGAAAELAPVRLWLEGGAEVLWIDINPPPAALLADNSLAGTLRWSQIGADLLRQPARVKATLESFARGERIDVGLYAYAPGRGREWRLAGTMNAIVDSLPVDLVRTITMLVSPTTPGLRTPHELEGENRRLTMLPRWQSALHRVGLLGRGPGHAQHGAAAANRGVVAIQGSSYQAAQYLAKLMAVEAWMTAVPPRHVSATMAGISRTESVRHPVFDAAFDGATAFGVETFEPGTTASLNGLLALRDWLDPAAPCRPKPSSHVARAWVAGPNVTRIHGGLYELPYPLEPSLRIAAVLGVVKNPRHLTAMVRQRKPSNQQSSR